jgi:hypothetical protein
MLRLAAVVLACSTFTASADDKAVELFNGKDLTGWKVKGDEKTSKWTVGNAKEDAKKPDSLAVQAPSQGSTVELINTKPGSHDLFTEEKFGDVHLELEFMIPKGSNSGVYLMGEYEVQIYDTHGKTPPKLGDMASIYTYAAPKTDASKPHGEWQKLEIDFVAPKFADGKKTSNAKFTKVVFNGTVIHENVECTKGVTPGGLTGKEAATGPIMFQGDHGAVSFRNIKTVKK